MPRVCAHILGVGPFLLSQKPFLLSEYTYSTVFYPFLPVFYTFPKTDRILQNTSRTHKNTQEYEHVEECERHIHRKCENTTEYQQNTGILQEFTQNTEAFRIPLKNTARNRAEYAKEYRILHRIQNTAKNTVFFMQNTDVKRLQARVWIVCAPQCRLLLDVQAAPQ